MMAVKEEWWGKNGGETVRRIRRIRGSERIRESEWANKN